MSEIISKNDLKILVKEMLMEYGDNLNLPKNFGKNPPKDFGTRATDPYPKSDEKIALRRDAVNVLKQMMGLMDSMVESLGEDNDINAALAKRERIQRLAMILADAIMREKF